MKRPSLILGVVALAASAISMAALGACNSVLGIERATLVDGGSMGSDLLTCGNYCTVIMQNCTGKNLEYLSNDACLKMCSYMTKGQLYAQSNEPENVDSLGCRLWHANTAGAHNPEVHCRHAGPLGTELCGGPCNPFCGLDWHFCTDDNGINVYDGQVIGCESVCTGDAGFPYLQDSGDIVDPTGAMIETGNTLNCRLWHLETAIDKNQPVPHCGHTGRTSDTCQ